jgi:hypothetical protein
MLPRAIMSRGLVYKGTLSLQRHLNDHAFQHKDLWACKKMMMEETIFSLKHYWRFVDSKALELKVLSSGESGKAA